jgi:ActR/RegA family two-component response regulator
MLLQPAPSIHTAFMRFPIDVVFVDGTLKVRKTVRELRPWRMASAHGALGVVELAAGEVGRREIMIGDQLGVVEVTDRLGAFMARSGWTHGHWDGSGFGCEDLRPLDPRLDRAQRDEADVTHVPSNEPTKVLLLGADRRFRSVAAALLTRRGCEVTLADRSSNVAELAKREGADVVVLDAGVSLTNGAHVVAQVETVDPPAGIVVVADEAEKGLAAMPVLPKWGSFDELYRAIERARPIRAHTPSNGTNV